jgi:hypothetical protein
MSRSDSNGGIHAALNSLGGGYGASVESIVTKEITKIISSAMCGKNIRELIENLFGKMWKVAILFGVSYLMKNINKIGNVFSLILRMVVYKKMELNLKNNESVDFLFHKKLESFLCNGAEESKVQPINGLKMYQRKMDGKIQIEYIPMLHSSFIDARKKEAEESVKEFENLKEVYVNCIGSKKKPVEKYESKNFKAAAKIIEEFFKVRKCRNSFNSQAIVIDGPPGLGKTDFLNHVAWKKLADYIIYANLTKDEYMKNDFNYVVDKIYSISVTGTCVIHIDEIDKHLSHRIKTKYDELLFANATSEANEKSSTSDKKESEKVVTKIIPSFEDFERKEKEAFLYKLLHLIETDKFNDGVVVILTSNNFDSIFENVDMRHFQSMKRRFLRVRFEECDLEDFIGYCRFYNDSFKETYPEKYIPEDVFVEHIRKINPSLKIPFWHIHQGMIASSFCIPELINIINAYSPEEEPIFSLDFKPPSPSGGFVKSISKPMAVTPQPILPKVVIESNESQEEESDTIVKCKFCSTFVNPTESPSCTCCEDVKVNSGVICDECYEEEKCGHCDDCGESWCPEHWEKVSCKKCNTHLHDDEGEEKYVCLCKKCVNCNAVIENEEELFVECHLCGNSNCIKQECVNSLKRCSDCDNTVCHDCIKLRTDSSDGDSTESVEHYQCNYCFNKANRKDSPSCDASTNVVISPNLDKILENIPLCEVNVNYLAELKEYNLGEEAYKNLSLEYVHIANRIFQCSNPLNAILAYLSIISHETRGKGCEVKIYFACKIFEYALKEEFEELFRRSQKFQVTFFNKIEEFNGEKDITTNTKYQDIVSRIKIKYSFEYKEWLRLQKEEE